MYAAELVYFVWILLSLSLCAGMFVECPVQERHTRIRYYLNVLGLKQSIYWSSNLAFDLLIFLIQAFFMIALIYPLNLEAYLSQYSTYITLILTFGLAHISFSYFVSFWFSNPQSALKAFSMIYLLGGFFFPFLIKNMIFAFFGCQAYQYSEIAFQLIPLQPLYVGFMSLIKKKHAKFFDF